MHNRTAVSSAFFTASCLLLSYALPAAELSTTELPPLQLAPKLSVSGLSSGGYMANQFHLAFSDKVTGAGIIAAGPYGCAQNSLPVALEHCFNKDSSAPDLVKAGALLQQQAAAGTIAPLSHLKDSPVFLLHGTADKTVHSKVSDALATQYQQLGSKVQYVNDKAFGHNFPTANQGAGCELSEAPYLGACGYDAAGALLKHIYPHLQARAVKAGGQLLTLQQQKLAGDTAATLGETGYIYIPQSCATGVACTLHISFHGCKQYAGAVGDAYAKGTGLNEWADSNNMVVLYPQTEKSAMAPFNPNGCWDWWGYTDGNYANQQGPQLKAVMAIAKAIGFKG
ncbi:PHB depolymerase family esterase [Rheinheimera texasensis]|uniref:extracellular catalytic domain type 2 short-chain-length polyhydroxyalkanoate depolymerase n=1 Tax=Rheinheimera texasensis TaxID=306205 RepID=UPI0004E13739|nr:PHB depolymerase family esterase [Rheinheimera texasensis]